jgi:hypothetical protein
MWITELHSLQFAQQLQKPFLIAGFHELLHQSRRGDECDRESVLAGGGTQSERGRGLAVPELTSVVTFTRCRMNSLRASLSASISFRRGMAVK